MFFGDTSERLAADIRIVNWGEQRIESSHGAASEHVTCVTCWMPPMLTMGYHIQQGSGLGTLLAIFGLQMSPLLCYQGAPWGGMASCAHHGTYCALLACLPGANNVKFEVHVPGNEQPIMIVKVSHGHGRKLVGSKTQG